MLSDHRYPCFRNFNSAVSIDVIRMKSYVDSLFDPACVSVGVTIDKLDFNNFSQSLGHFLITNNNNSTNRNTINFFEVQFE